MSENNYQVLITTHSPNLVTLCNYSNVIHVCKDVGDYVVKQGEEADIKTIVADLGIKIESGLVKLFGDRTKALFLVEGPDDVKAMHHTARIYNKALTESELNKNYDSDSKRYIGIIRKEAVKDEVIQTGNLKSTTGSLIYNSNNSYLNVERGILNVNKANMVAIENFGKVTLGKDGIINLSENNNTGILNYLGATILDGTGTINANSSILQSASLLTTLFNFVTKQLFAIFFYFLFLIYFCLIFMSFSNQRYIFWLLIS